MKTNVVYRATCQECTETNEVELKPSLIFAVPIQNSSNSSGTLDLSPGNVLNDQSNPSQTEEDDFGDFIAVRNDKKTDSSQNYNDLSDLGNKKQMQSNSCICFRNCKFMVSMQ